MWNKRSGIQNILDLSFGCAGVLRLDKHLETLYYINVYDTARETMLFSKSIFQKAAVLIRFNISTGAAMRDYRCFDCRKANFSCKYLCKLVATKS